MGARIILTSIVACSLATLGLAGEETKEPRYARRAPTESSVAPTQASDVPEALRPGALRGARTRPDGPSREHAAADADHGNPPPDRDPGRRDWIDQLDARAVRAGQRAADEALAAAGRTQYYRVGFYEGLQAGLARPALHRWSGEEGQRAGSRDAIARADGQRAGQDGAVRLADASAAAEVRRQYSDLSRDPVFDPVASHPRFVAPDLDFRAPRLRDVVAEFPPDPRHLAGWSYDIVRLVDCPAYEQFYDASWGRADRALDRWRRDGGRQAGYHALDAWERERFDAGFEVAFERRISRRFDDLLHRAHDEGFHAGWSYGTFIGEELEYRRGYQRGYRDAFRQAAGTAFRRTWDRAYAESYEQRFAAWAGSARTELGNVRVVDGDDDGVFSPGERLVVEYEVINYGGGEGRLPVSLYGDSLVATEVASTRVAPRSVTTKTFTPARIDERIAPRTRDRIELRVGESRVWLPLVVANPLQIEPGEIGLVRNDLQGELVVDVLVRNASRRSRSGSLFVAAGRAEASEELGSLEPGATRRVSLVLDGLDPLTLIAGDQEVDLTLASGGTPQDALRRRVPDTVRDLGNDDLLGYTLLLGASRSVDPARTARLRELWVLRLREDWKVAAMGSGNPYRRDLRNGSTETALGGLVQTLASAEQRHARPPAVLAGMSREVLALSRTLPGPHPFLRKSMRRLAVELP